MILYSEIVEHVLMPFLVWGKIIEVDQSAIGKLLYCTNRKVPTKISRWRLVPMENW